MEWSEWREMRVQSGHAKGRTIQDALMELHMNGFDAQKKAVSATEPPKIDTEDGKVIVVSNASTKPFHRDHLLIGRRQDGDDDPTTMGQYGLGLKDALAVLLREGCKVALVSHGQQIEFEKTAPGGLVPGFEAQGPLEIHGSPHEEAGMLCYRIALGASASAAHTWVYTITTTTLGPNEEEIVSAVGAVKKYLTPPDRAELLYEDENVAIFKPNSKNGKNISRYALGDDNTGGVYVGDRFVDFPSSENFTYFGYRFKKPTKEMKDEITRDQKLSRMIINKKSPFKKLLERLWGSTAAWDKLKEHMPPQASFELAAVCTFAPSLKKYYAKPAAAPSVRPPSKVATSTAAARKATEHADSPVICNWFAQNRSIRRHLDPHRLKSLKVLQKIVEATFPDDYAQVVPYGSTIYEVCVADSDIDATLLVQSASAEEQSPTERLEVLMIALKREGIDVHRVKGIHPILVLQKDAAKGIHFAVDISFAGHLEIHKSHEVRQRFESIGGTFAFDLARLVKTWMRRCGICGTWEGYLSSHAWMLLVVMYTMGTIKGTGKLGTASGFFAWFVDNYHPNTQWYIGHGEAPLKFEQENVASAVNAKKKTAIYDAAVVALKKTEAGELPW